MFGTKSQLYLYADAAYAVHRACLDKQFSFEHFEPAVAQSTVPSPPLSKTLLWPRGHIAEKIALRLREDKLRKDRGAAAKPLLGSPGLSMNDVLTTGTGT